MIDDGWAHRKAMEYIKHSYWHMVGVWLGGLPVRRMLYM